MIPARADFEIELQRPVATKQEVRRDRIGGLLFSRWAGRGVAVNGIHNPSFAVAEPWALSPDERRLAAGRETDDQLADAERFTGRRLHIDLRFPLLRRAWSRKHSDDRTREGGHEDEAAFGEISHRTSLPFERNRQAACTNRSGLFQFKPPRILLAAVANGFRYRESSCGGPVAGSLRAPAVCDDKFSPTVELHFRLIRRGARAPSGVA